MASAINEGELEELDKHLWELEEAKKRDHRKLGKELELFFIDEVVFEPGTKMWISQPKCFSVSERLRRWFPAP